MASIYPFKAWRYDPQHVPVQLAVTQPYDKITPALQDHYYEASPYNLVRIILGKRLPGDGDAGNVYTRAAASFQSWRQTGVLRRDAEPSLYRYSQTFKVPGTEARAERRSFIALGRLEQYSAGVVFRHEQTLAKPKADRLDLLRATRAHFGQIFMLYSDPAAEIESAMASPDPPLMEMTDEYGVLHRVWSVSDPEIVALICDKMRDKKLIIADGHHRYETALTYRNERRAAGSGAAREIGKSSPAEDLAPHDLAMMTFVNMDSPGLLILPTHRVV